MARKLRSKARVYTSFGSGYYCGEILENLFCKSVHIRPIWNIIVTSFKVSLLMTMCNTYYILKDVFCCWNVILNAHYFDLTHNYRKLRVSQLSTLFTTWSSRLCVNSSLILNKLKILQFCWWSKNLWKNQT